MGAEENQSRYFARLSQGSLGRACQWARLEPADANLYQTKKQLLDSLVEYEYAGALDLAQWLLDEARKIATFWADLEKNTSRKAINRKVQKTVVQIIISALHDVMKLNVIHREAFINFDQKDRIQKLATRFTPEQAGEKIADCYETLRWIDSSVNERLIFEQLLLNLVTSGRMRIYK
jgi:hypothetical protein